MGSPVFFPSPLPDYIRRHPRRSAECAVYDILQRTLTGDWHVYYSRPWLGLDRDGRDKEGEADFVLAHPKYGMLVLEVKGGVISHDAKTGKWYTTNAKGERFGLKRPPDEQASRNKHSLREFLKAQPGWSQRDIVHRIGVVFPDCTISGPLTSALPRYVVAGFEDMPKLGAWVERRQTAGDEEVAGCDVLGEDGLAILDRYFARSFQLEMPQAASLVNVDTEVRVMTDRQALVLGGLLNGAQRMAIPGAAGTGKTTIALEKAMRLAREGSRTLFLTFNRPLAQQLRFAQPEAACDIRSVGALANQLARSARLDFQSEQDEGPPSHKLIPPAIAVLGGGAKYDAIIVDEGQDFAFDALESIEALLRDPERGLLLVFFDDNQKVMNNGGTLAHRLPIFPLPLRQVVRNSRPIGETLLPLLPQNVELIGPDGPSVEWKEVDGNIGAAVVADLLDELCNVRRISPGQITVLARDQAAVSSLLIRGAIGKRRVRNAEERPDEGAVCCETVRRFKGLESQVVVVVSPSEYLDERELLYIALSRARSLLIIVDQRGRSGLLRRRLSE
jgi:Nuclease-related domain/UvrD-like helicase C-terminal domain/Uncharacterized conserved protein (DUF2075)